MKVLIVVLLLSAASLACANTQDDLYRSLSKSYAEQCEAKASSAGVSRPNVQILTNNCLHDYIIKTTRKFERADLDTAIRMYQKGVFIQPETDEVSMGSNAQKALEVELGKKINLLKNNEG